MQHRILGLTLALAVGSSAALAQTIAPPGPTVNAIKQRGQLVCGTDTGIPGFAYQDNTGKWLGIRCRLRKRNY